MGVSRTPDARGAQAVELEDLSLAPNRGSSSRPPTEDLHDVSTIRHLQKDRRLLGWRSALQMIQLKNCAKCLEHMELNTAKKRRGASRCARYALSCADLEASGSRTIVISKLRFTTISQSAPKLADPAGSRAEIACRAPEHLSGDRRKDALIAKRADGGACCHRSGKSAESIQSRFPLFFFSLYGQRGMESCAFFSTSSGTQTAAWRIHSFSRGRCAEPPVGSIGAAYRWSICIRFWNSRRVHSK